MNRTIQLRPSCRTSVAKRTFGVAVGSAMSLGCLGLATAAPAVAAPVAFVEHYVDHDQLLLGNDDCVPFPLMQTTDAWGTFHAVTHGDSPYYGADAFNAVTVFENLDNGKTFTRVAHGVDMDLHITDDGTGVLTIEGHETGGANYYGPDGKKVFHDAGLFTYTVVIDTHGTDDPNDDEEVSFTPVGYTGLSQTGERDFCVDMIALLG